MQIKEVVVKDTKKYIAETDRQLKVTISCKKLQNDPTHQYNKLVNYMINRFKKEKLLPHNIASGLTTTNPRTPKFYVAKST